MQKLELVIFGASNMISDIVECAIAHQITPKKVILDSPEPSGNRDIPIARRLEMLNEYFNTKITLEPLTTFTPKANEIYVLGPTTPQREDLARRINSNYQLQFHNLIHPTAYLSPMTKLGQGVFVGAKSVLGPGTRFGDHVFINRGVTIGHDTHVGSYSRIQPGCNVGGLSQIGKSVSVGIGATIVDRIAIGDYSVVAAGSCVLNDIGANLLVAGSPATIKRAI